MIDWRSSSLIFGMFRRQCFLDSTLVTHMILCGKKEKEGRKREDLLELARSDTRELYHRLVASRFSFMPRGRFHVDEIYARIREKYPGLCDDKYRCRDNCLSMLSRPEWQHISRGALDALKDAHSAGRRICKASKRGYWVFQ